MPFITALMRMRLADLWVQHQPGLQSEVQDRHCSTEKPCPKQAKQNETKTDKKPQIQNQRKNKNLEDKSNHHMSKLTRRKATHSSRNFCLARATLLNTCCAESQRLYYWWDSHILVYLVNERFSTNRWGRETVLFLKIRDCSVRTFKFKCCSLVLARSGRTWECYKNASRNYKIYKMPSTAPGRGY